MALLELAIRLHPNRLEEKINDGRFVNENSEIPGCDATVKRSAEFLYRWIQKRCYDDLKRFKKCVVSRLVY